MVSDDAIRAAILSQTVARASASVCPSEVARSLATDPAGDWRPLMADVRRVAGVLAAAGDVVVTQRGHPVGVDAAGPIRLTRRRGQGPDG